VGTHVATAAIAPSSRRVSVAPGTSRRRYEQTRDALTSPPGTRALNHSVSNLGARPRPHQAPLQPVNGQPNDEDAGVDGKAAAGGRPRRRFVELLMDGDDDAAEHDTSTASVGAATAAHEEEDDDTGAVAGAAGVPPESPSLRGPLAKRARTRAVALRG